MLVASNSKAYGSQESLIYTLTNPYSFEPCVSKVNFIPSLLHEYFPNEVSP